MSRIICAHATDQGRRRDHNEDSYSADAENGLFIVADGMGGREGGGVASSIVVRSVRQDVLKGRSLADALMAAHANLLQAAKNGVGRPGMGATAVVLRMTGADYEVAWVGDSRAYRWNGGLKCLTRDHSLVQEMLDTGVLTVEEARTHPRRNVLTHALGVEGRSEMTVGAVAGTLPAEGSILLCSDGLTNELADDVIAAILGRNLPAQDGVSALIQAANDQAGRDNITVVLVSLKTEAAEADDDDTLPQKIDDMTRWPGKEG